MVSVGAAAPLDAEMERKNHGGRGRGSGEGHGGAVEGKPLGAGGGFQADDLGFDPGYGDDRRDCGRGWQRGGARFRGPMGFAPRRDGFAGQRGRGALLGCHGGADAPAATAQCTRPLQML